MSNEKFMFYENFLNALDLLPEGEREKACYEFCKYGITGELPKDRSLAMFCIGVSASVRKYDGRGGAREGSGAPKGNQNAVKKQSETEEQSENKINQKQSKQSKTEKQSKQSEITNINLNINKNINFKKDNSKELSKKVKIEEVCDWESLFDYWEQNKKGGKYKNQESRNRQLAKLKQLTEDKFERAKQAIIFCVDNNYQGFTDGQKLYYRGEDGENTVEETVTIDENLKFDETTPEFSDMTFDDCCLAYEWLQSKMYLQTISKKRFIEIVRKFKTVATA